MLLVLFIGVNSLSGFGNPTGQRSPAPVISSEDESAPVEVTAVPSGEDEINGQLEDSETAQKKVVEKEQGDGNAERHAQYDLTALSMKAENTEESAAQVVEEAKENPCQLPDAPTVEDSNPWSAGQEIWEYPIIETFPVRDENCGPDDQQTSTPEIGIPEAEHQETKEENIPVPEPVHSHSYTATAISPTCSTGGYTLYSCACGDSYTGDEVPALGHDWVSYTERIVASQEPHEICGDCGLDLTASGITGAAIAQHAKQHVLTDETATGRTYTTLIESHSDVTISVCSRCGESR